MNTNNYNNSPAAAKDPVLISFPYETNLLQAGSTNTQIVLSSEASKFLIFIVIVILK
jgi:hypothetical protein